MLDQGIIDAIFAPLDDGQHAGVAVGIASKGLPLYRKAFGLASMDLPVRLDPTMRLRIGSTTKQFACLAYMLLCETGEAGLDDPVAKFLPEMPRAITRLPVRSLMTHLNGLWDVYDLCWQFGDPCAPLSREAMIGLYAGIDGTTDEPGRVWRYNNGAYLLLGAIIERTSGESLDRFLEQRIFSRIGMDATHIRRSDKSFFPHSATLHMNHPDGSFDRSSFGTDLDMAGGLSSTVDDLLRWLAHMASPEIGNAASWAALLQPAMTSDGLSTGYGLGLMTGTYRGRRTIRHPGGVMGGNCEMLKLPDDELDIVVISNRHDVSAPDLALSVLDAWLGEAAPPLATKEPLASGLFRSPKTGRIIQLSARGIRQIVSIDGFDLAFQYDESGRWLTPVETLNYLKQSLVLVGDEEAPEALEFEDFGNHDRLVRLPAASRPSFETITGCFGASVLGLEADIGCIGGEMVLTTSGPFGAARFTLEALADTVWRAHSAGVMPWGGILNFDPSGSFIYTTPRTRALAFERRA